MRQAMGYLDEIADKDTMVSLAKTLQAVTEGKVGAREELPAHHVPPCLGHLWQERHMLGA